MMEAGNLAPSLMDEHGTTNLGLVNNAPEGTSGLQTQTPHPSLRREETKSSELEQTNKQLEDGNDVSSDEWWNYVNALVKTDEAEASDNNNDNEIRPVR